MLSPNNVAEFWNRGFVLFDLWINAEECRSALQEVENLEDAPVFGDVYDEARDEFLEQANMTQLTPTLTSIHETVVDLVSINGNWSIEDSGWRALRTYPGGPDQTVHRDFPKFETSQALITRELVQASIIVALWMTHSCTSTRVLLTVKLCELGGALYG
ncbi:hypothetical protein V7S43_012383 [Phytophthora oleae]|uniref:Uncharacterized protein n=1 Tax=Phytophthora oleae TaxID=2107226 RepID=A0ABD3F714_9STRA